MGLEPASFTRATIHRHLFLGDARSYRIALSKQISLLAVACCFCVSRPEWCQKWCQMISATPSFLMGLIAAGTSSGRPTASYVSVPYL